jgi:hypothetical protein
MAVCVAKIERNVDAEFGWRGILKNMYMFLKK